MSTAMAIATVTDTLRGLISAALSSDHNLPSDAGVTVQPPDKAHDDQQVHFVNLFLYQVLPNAAWRNIDAQSLMKPGSTGMPPLALSLYYMLTAYSQGDDVGPLNVSTISHRLLGRAMSTLHDHALLLGDDIALARPESELQNQIDRVRITLQPLTVEEIFRLWSGFQTQYRISVAYEVSVVLIDSTQPARTPLPVLIPNLAIRQFRQPIIERITPDSITAGKQITIQGYNLKGDTVMVKIGDTRLQPDSVSEKQILVTLPNTLLAGVNTIQVEQGILFGLHDKRDPNTQKLIPLPSDINPGHRGFESNIQPFVLHPTVGQLQFSQALDSTDPAGIRRIPTLTVPVNPPIGKTQRVVLVLNEFQSARMFSFNAPSRDPNGPAFSPSIDIPIVGVPKGKYLVRILIDGADSPLEIDTQQGPTFNQFIRPQVDIP